MRNATVLNFIFLFISFVGKYTPQYNWLKQELPKVNRSETPWLIVLLHSPWYNSYNYHYMEGETMRVMFEPWFVQNKVDIVFAGHVHGYERSVSFRLHLQLCLVHELLTFHSANYFPLSMAFFELGACFKYRVRYCEWKMHPGVQPLSTSLHHYWRWWQHRRKSKQVRLGLSKCISHQSRNFSHMGWL